MDFPLTLTGSELDTMKDEPFVIWRPHYVKMEAPTNQQLGPWYAMKPDHARDIARSLLQLADRVDTRTAQHAPKRVQ